MRSEVQSSARPERSASILPDLARATALVVLYVVSGRIGLALAHEQDNATLFWPPTGLAIAALLLLGPRFADRPGGYCRIIKLAKRRLGDGGERAILEFVERTPKDADTSTD